MLYGVSFIFGMSGSTLLTDVAAYAKTNPDPLFAVAIFLTIGGFAFKISAVPFHFWAPDTYEGAPTPVTAFLSVASKAGGLVALITIIRFGFFPSTPITKIAAFPSRAEGQAIHFPSGEQDARPSHARSLVTGFGASVYGGGGSGAFPGSGFGITSR